MKNILRIFFICSFISCKAQSNIANIDHRYKGPVSTYFADIEGIMDKFVGTWVYTDGQRTFTLVIQKKLKVPFDHHFEDLFIAGYTYEENGSTIANTLPQLNDPTIIGRKHHVSGREIWMNDGYFPCPDCGPDEKRFTLSFYDATRPYLATPAQMHVRISEMGGTMLPTETSPVETRVPYGEYIMTKQ